MAKIQTKYTNGKLPMPIPVAQEKLVQKVTLAITAAQLLLNNVFAMLVLPADCVPVGYVLRSADLDSNGSPAIALDLGVVNAAGNAISTSTVDGGAKWVAGSTLAQAGGILLHTASASAYDALGAVQPVGYAFFNASVQGTARIAETLKGPAGKRIIAGGVLLGVVQALALAAAGFGDDEPPEFVRDRSVILPIGDGKYLTFPLPLGFNVLPAVGRIITEWALDGGRDTGKRATHLIEVFMDMFNPIGNAGMSMQTLAPTTLDPLVALTENKDWTGRPIAKQDFNSLDPTPGFSRSRDKAWEASVQIAKAINWITGGTDFKPGAISPTADQLEYLAGQLTGGVGREAIKLGTTADALTTGENLPPHKVPLLGRFYGDASGQSAQGNQFYENLRKMHEHENEIVGRRKTGGDVAGYRSDNPEANLVAQAKLAEKVVGKLKKRRRMLVESGADREAIKAIDDRITDYMRRFNERVKGAREKEAA
ncbi:LPD38 domain-containing protein [Methylovorus mays]|uniref:LPD38 domain-containing protein n=1 Tax=Methylovorus mays TaxID=184077 RepID=UPI001E63ACD8|nr:LPD38 domain-containing protein [Methylovorus mays]MCB5206103.1 hypothetical protein [Methylovorus mays]